MTSAKITRQDISRDDMLSLEAVAELAFPDGTVTATVLKAAARQGKLPFTRIGKRYYTTLAAIEGAYQLCHAPQKVRTCISADASAANQPSSSETEGMRQARAALKASIAELKKNSRPILQQNTDLPLATVTRLEFPSPTSSRFTPRKDVQ